MSFIGHITRAFKVVTTGNFGCLLSLSSPTLEDARVLSEDLHAHQFDTATNTPYYTHPARVEDIYCQLKPNASDEERMAARLHDGLEDGMITDKSIGQRRKFTYQDFVDLCYPPKTILMVCEVSKAAKEGKDNRNGDQKLADNRAFVETLVDTGSFEGKLLKFSDALSNRERQVHETMKEHDADFIAYRRQKTDDTLQILYNDTELRPYFDRLGYESLDHIINYISDAQTHYVDTPVTSDAPVADV